MSGGAHPANGRPAVYLDQWVWVRLARARLGRPGSPGDVRVLDAVLRAADAGVRFPLAHVHYIETAAVKNPRQRNDLAAVMGPVSGCVTIRGGRDLVRHQFLTAMHEQFGRPAFPPPSPRVLGTGARWAFTGVAGHLRLHGPDGPVDEHGTPGLRMWLRLLNQHYELRALAGPSDAEVDDLRRNYGYRPETAEKSGRSRLAWEEVYRGLLAADPVSRAELRVRTTVRELTHEYLDHFNSLMAEYRLTLGRVAGEPSTRSREKMMAFADRVPTLRLSAAMKAELFRDRSRPWKLNDVHDIDAVSLAVPYCRVVVADTDACHRFGRVRTDAEEGTTVVARLPELVDLLPGLEAEAVGLGGDASGWDWLGPGVGFDGRKPPPLGRGVVPDGSRVRYEKDTPR